MILKVYFDHITMQISFHTSVSQVLYTQKILYLFILLHSSDKSRDRLLYKDFLAYQTYDRLLKLCYGVECFSLNYQTVYT